MIGPRRIFHNMTGLSRDVTRFDVAVSKKSAFQMMGTSHEATQKNGQVCIIQFQGEIQGKRV